MIALGVGCRRDCPTSDVVAVCRSALAALGDRRCVLMAVPTFKGGEAGVREAATVLGFSLVQVDDAALAEAQSRCATFSATVERLVGVGSVAEAAALAAAGAGSRLVVRRVAAGSATCAAAEGADP